MGAESFLTLQIVDFAEGVDDRVAALLQAGTGITLTYNDGAGTLTIASTVSASFASLSGSPSDNAALASALNGKSDFGHGHTISDVTNLQSSLDGKSSVGHTHAISDITSLQTSLDSKATLSHTHAIADVTNLQTSLDGKAATTHTHVIADTTGLQSALDAKLNLSGGTMTGKITATATGNLNGGIGNGNNGIDFFNGIITYLNNAGGILYPSYFTVNGGVPRLKLSSNSLLGWGSSVDASVDANIDISLARNTTGQLDVRGNSGLRVRNLANNADASLTAGAITASGKITVSQSNQTDYLVQITNNTTSGTFPVRNGLLIETTGTGGASSLSQLLRINSYGATVLAVTPGATTLNTSLDGIGNLTSVRHLITNDAPSIPSLIVRSGTTPTANIQEWQDNSFVVRASITPAFGINAVAGTFSGLVTVGTYTVATLPSAAANAGALAQVTDSSVTANGSAVAGGGSNRVVVFSNGSTWDVVVA